jgi:predicted MFS family arabinose efflux permease
MTTALPQAGRVSWTVKATVVSANAPLAMLFTVIAPVLAKMSDELARSPTDVYLVRMTVGVAGAAMVVGAPLSGYLADKFSRGRILLGSGLLFALAGLAPALFDNLELILVARFLTGLAAMSFGTVGATIVGDYFAASERVRWMGVLVTGALIFSLAGSPIAGWFGDFGWRWVFALYLVGIPLGVIAWLGVRHSEPARRPQTAAPTGATSGGTQAPRVSLPIGLMVIALFIGIMVFVPRTYIPFLLRELDIKNPSSVGLILTIEGVVGVLLASQFRKVRQVLTSRALFSFTFGASAAGIAALALAPAFHALALVWLGLLLMGVGVAWLPPNIMALIVMTVEEDRRGRTMGIVRGAEALAPAAGITAFEPVVQRFGVVGALWMIAALLAIIAAAMAIKALARLLIPVNAED